MASFKSKIPLRGIAKLFNHLDPGVRAKLESAFVEAENLIDIHNTSIVNQQTRRKISGLVDAPVVTVTTNSKGFDASWPRLDDQRISFYEVQMSTTSNFADPTTFTVVETSLAVEGVGSTVYIRVRGVRWDGDTGNWSEPQSVDATSTAGPLVYSRGLSDIPSFYIADPGVLYPKAIQHLTVTPGRQNGGFLIFGSFGTDAHPGNDPALIITLNGVTYSSISAAEYMLADGVGAVPMGFGPVFVSHNEFYFGDQNTNTPGTKSNSGSNNITGGGVASGWTLTDPYTFDCTWTGIHGIAYCETKQIDFTNFGFAIPLGNTITGILLEWTAGDNNYSSGIYDPADLLALRLLDDTGSPRTNVSTGTQEWGDGTKTYGGRSNLWGETAGFWTPAKINDADFGVRFRGKMFVPAGTTIVTVQNRQITISDLRMTVYSTNETTGDVNIQVRYNGTSGGGVLKQCTLNVIEFGDAL